MKKLIYVVRCVAFAIVAISVCAIDSDSAIPVITLAVGMLILLATTFVSREDDDYEHTK